MACITMEAFANLIDEHVGEANVKEIIDVGSLDAGDAIYLKSRFPKANATAIEGLEKNYLDYMQNLDGITCINKVIASYDGQTKFFVKKTNGIHSMYDRGSIYGTEEIFVNCYRLDSIINFPIDVMKLDVEGATHDVFMGMGSLLDTIRIMHIETETVPYFSGQKKLHSEIYAFLKERNFRLLAEAGAAIGAGKQFDSVWLNNNMLRK